MGRLAAAAEPKLDHLAFGDRQLLESTVDLVGHVVLAHLLLGRGGVAVEQLAEAGRVVFADAGVEARGLGVQLAQALDLVGLEAGLGRDLLEGRLALKLGGQVGGHALDLAGLLGDVGGQADGAGRVVEPALDRLADPQRRVGGEAEALAVVELLRGADQADHALLDEVAHSEAEALVTAGDRDHQAQVGVDQQLLGAQVAALDALGKVELLARAQQAVLRRTPQELVDGVGDRGRLADLIGHVGVDVERGLHISDSVSRILADFRCVRNFQLRYTRVRPGKALFPAVVKTPSRADSDAPTAENTYTVYA